MKENIVKLALWIICVFNMKHAHKLVKKLTFKVLNVLPVTLIIVIIVQLMENAKNALILLKLIMIKANVLHAIFKIAFNVQKITCVSLVED